ncbi:MULTISPECIES: YgaP family membrane protein [Alteribacter]|uniref:DUF2892 domain-containing protein n=1 Tax=Alteribacter keqinensis TaxID=2483800 RepID=A0A3M7TQV3_9BACI|nr:MULTISPECIES: DUF2892 domain-containing protein [Alteribacter]MBM7094923.1 DUF2892 domain-containing protein [Alteribacter salitolerans]RNA66730.1 DUF2892 domain-containing protein [Alteribacter keqinensis]
MRPNIGIVNAMIRLTLGFTLLAWATAKMGRRCHKGTPLFVAIIGAMKVAEGITKFCPVTYAVEEQAEKMSEDDFDIGPMNPS